MTHLNVYQKIWSGTKKGYNSGAGIPMKNGFPQKYWCTPNVQRHPSQAVINCNGTVRYRYVVDVVKEGILYVHYGTRTARIVRYSYCAIKILL